MAESYNPDFTPTGIEGGVDTNLIPWLELPQAPGLKLKPLRASTESGRFSCIVRLEAGTRLANLVHLGAMDMMLLSGTLHYPGAPLQARLQPGTWGYVPANTRVQSLSAEQDAEFLANFYGPVAFLGANDPASDSSSSASAKAEVVSLLTALDVLQAAGEAGLQLVPNTLAECMAPRSGTLEGSQARDPAPLAIAGSDAGSLVSQAGEVAQDIGREVQPHFVDTRALPWIVNPGLPDIALKIMRVSEETGTTSLIVRHNGVAGPHYHLGAADFLVLSGHIGYRAGPPEGYGPGVWFFEPAGARHEATQRIGTDDLIYTANVYGPVQFDEGAGTPIAAVQSWMQYKELADAAGVELVRNTVAGDASLLAWAPLGA